MKQLKYTGMVFFSLILISLPLYAEIYSWVDDQGVRHFGNTNPSDQSTTVEVIEEVKATKPKKEVKRDFTARRKRMEQKRAAEEDRKKRKKLAAEQEKKVIIAYVSLKKIETIVLSDVVWSEYRVLLSEARSALGHVGATTRKTSLLNEACGSYETALQLRAFYIAKKNKSLIQLLKKMNQYWGSQAKTYYSGRKMCWGRATDKLTEYLL